MKRYVIELANDIRKQVKYSDCKTMKIKRIISYCEKGYITDIEAATALTTLFKEDVSNEIEEEKNN